MSQNYKATLIYGDGIGEEISRVTQKVIDATGCKIDWQIAEAGAKVFEKGITTGVPKETLDSIKETGVLLKGPLMTPIGHGGKSFWLCPQIWNRDPLFNPRPLSSFLKQK